MNEPVLERKIITPPYVKHVRNQLGVGSFLGQNEFEERRTCRLFHMGMEGRADMCVVPIIWKKLLNPSAMLEKGKLYSDPLSFVECIGIIWGPYLNPKSDEYVVTTRFRLALSEYLALQVGEIDV